MSQEELPGKWERVLRATGRGSSLSEESTRERIETLMIASCQNAALDEMEALRSIVRTRKGI